MTRNILYSVILLSLVLPAISQAAITIDRGEFGALGENPFECGAIVTIFFGCGPAGATTASQLIYSIINILLAIVGLLSVLFVIIGGLRYVTAHSNEEQAAAAKKTIVNAIIGIAIVILSFVIIRVIAEALLSGTV